jgi:hypothetical protein
VALSLSLDNVWQSPGTLTKEVALLFVAASLMAPVATPVSRRWRPKEDGYARHGWWRCLVRWAEASGDSEERGWHHSAQDVGWRRRSQGRPAAFGSALGRLRTALLGPAQSRRTFMATRVTDSAVPLSQSGHGMWLLNH